MKTRKFVSADTDFNIETIEILESEVNSSSAMIGQEEYARIKEEFEEILDELLKLISSVDSNESSDDAILFIRKNGTWLYNLATFGFTLKINSTSTITMIEQKEHGKNKEEFREILNELYELVLSVDPNKSSDEAILFIRKNGVLFYDLAKLGFTIDCSQYVK